MRMVRFATWMRNGYESYNGLWYADKSNVPDKYCNTYGLRPVITLKSNIQTSGGDGSEGSAFKLVPQ